MVIVIIIVALLLLIGLIYVLVRNSLISLNQRVEESWSGIDVQLKRRHDLVPNLVETVKGYATHESRDLREGDSGARRGHAGERPRAKPARRRDS